MKELEVWLWLEAIIEGAPDMLTRMPPTRAFDRTGHCVIVFRIQGLCAALGYLRKEGVISKRVHQRMDRRINRYMGTHSNPVDYPYLTTPGDWDDGVRLAAVRAFIKECE
jgi:hypothetical protein